MASPLNNFDFLHFPPPPPQSLPPPTTHFIPPPTHFIPPPPPPSPDNNTTIIVIVFVSFGGLFYLAFLAVALCCVIKKKKTVQETEIIHADEHLKVKETIVAGPQGPQAVVLSIEDDVHVEEVVRKNEQFGEGMHAKSADTIASTLELEEGTSTSSSNHHHLEQKP